TGVFAATAGLSMKASAATVDSMAVAVSTEVIVDFTEAAGFAAAVDSMVAEATAAGIAKSGVRLNSQKQLERPAGTPASRFRFDPTANANFLGAHAFVSGLGKLLRKPEGILRCSIFLVMLQPLAAFGHDGNVSNGNPPQAVSRHGCLLEPFRPVAKDFHVI